MLKKYVELTRNEALKYPGIRVSVWYNTRQYSDEYIKHSSFTNTTVGNYNYILKSELYKYQCKLKDIL